MDDQLADAMVQKMDAMTVHCSVVMTAVCLVDQWAYMSDEKTVLNSDDSWETMKAMKLVF